MGTATAGGTMGGAGGGATTGGGAIATLGAGAGSGGRLWGADTAGRGAVTSSGTAAATGGGDTRGGGAIGAGGAGATAGVAATAVAGWATGKTAAHTLHRARTPPSGTFAGSTR